jgi:midasin
MIRHDLLFQVIPYIASHFRRDKIWLRRTKPNKRNYQVVIAIDDSRSMSEGKCGQVAIEALVTVCRAMSQLEVGQFAVASFGKKGNVRGLHDFDQIFNSEAGVKVSALCYICLVISLPFFVFWNLLHN